MNENTFYIDDEFGIRVDVYLSNRFENISRSYIQNLIDNGNVKINNTIKKSNYKLKQGDIIEVEIPEPEEMSIEAEKIDLNIMYEDTDIIVVNKPQGMVVHPAPGVYKGTLVNALLAHCKDLSGINGVLRPGIVHRIDKDTSGVLVVAKNDFAHKKLSEQLKDHSMVREYIAITEGVIKKDKGIIETNLARHPKERVKIAVVPESEGRTAVTHYEVLERYKNNTLIKCNLETGRTHQIRVHMAYIRHPLVGDPVYGYKKQKYNLKGQMLHAKKLGFIHPSLNRYMEFQSDLPDYFIRLIQILANKL